MSGKITSGKTCGFLLIKTDCVKEPGVIFKTLFGLEVVYDDQGILNRIAEGDHLLGCLFPDGEISPWGLDKLIVVNVTPFRWKKLADVGFNPLSHNSTHTEAHEGLHYVCHHLRGIDGIQYRKPTYCRSKDRFRADDFPEWQCDFGGGELLMPQEEVVALLDGKVSEEFWEQNAGAWRKEQEEIRQTVSQHERAKSTFSKMASSSSNSLKTYRPNTLWPPT